MSAHDEPAGGSEAARLAAALPAALAQRTPQAVERLLHPRVRWGGAEDTEQTCHNRAEVLGCYSRLLNDGVTIEVLDAIVEGDRVVLHTRVGLLEGDPSVTFSQQTQLTVRHGLIIDVLEVAADDTSDGPLIELLYFDGCPHHEQFLPHLQQLLLDVGLDADVHLIKVADDAAARRQKFLGSPTLRINGHDIDPTADDRHDYAMQCRLYPHDAGATGTPPDAWIKRALAKP